MKTPLLLSLILLGCNQNVEIPDPRTISMNPTFKPYIDMYVAYKGAPLNYDIPIAFTSMSSSRVGLCTRWSGNYRQIEVDPIYWQHISEEARVELIFHELGHCDLNRGHINTYQSNGWPTSIMNPYNFMLSNATINYYLYELFSITNDVSAQLAASACVLDID